MTGLLALAACSSPQKPPVHALPTAKPNASTSAPIEPRPEHAEAVACAQPGDPSWQDPPGYGELLRWIAMTAPPLTLWHTARVRFEPAPVSEDASAADVDFLALSRGGFTTLCAWRSIPPSGGDHPVRREPLGYECAHFEVALSAVRDLHARNDEGRLEIDFCDQQSGAGSATCYRWLLYRSELVLRQEPTGRTLKLGLLPALPKLDHLDFDAIQMPQAGAGEPAVIIFHAPDRAAGHKLVRSGDGSWQVRQLGPRDGTTTCAPVPVTSEAVTQPRLPEVRTGKGRTRGSLTHEVIRRVVVRHHPEVLKCYEAALARRPGLEGQITVRFHIDADGRVGRAFVEQSDLRDAAADQCVLDTTKLWSFPPPEGGGFVTTDFGYRLQLTATPPQP